MLVWKAHSRAIDALAFSADGRALAVGGNFLAGALFDASTGERRWSLEGPHSFCQSLAVVPGGSVLCKGSELLTLDAASGAPIRKCGEGWCQAFGVAPDGRTAFVSDGRYQVLVRRYNLEDGAVLGEAELDSGRIRRIAVSPDGGLVGVVGRKRFLLLNAGTLATTAADSQRGLSSGAFALAFSPCGRTLVYSAGRTLFVWDTAAARAVKQLQLDTKHFLDAAFTPDGRRLITVSKEGAARVWDAASWGCERAFAWDVGPLRAVAVSPDGTRAAAAGDSGRVVVWDLDE